MKTYKIGVSWECWGYVEVEAESVQDAMEKAVAFEKEID